MAKPYKLPIIQKDASGNLQRATSTNENYLAYQAGLRFAERGTLGPTAIKSSITIAHRDSAIGSYTDTFYNEAVGTHPGSSLSIGSTTTTLYQLKGDSASGAVKLDDQSTGLFRRPVYESDGNIFDMDSDAMDGIGQSLMSIIQSNEYPRSQRLAASAPSGDWSATLSNVFSDTTTDGTVTQYSIWQRQTITAPAKCNAMHVKRTQYGSYPLASYDGGLEAMTDSEMSLTFGQIAGKYFRHGEVGTYELRSSAQGAPTRTGTWEARGTALDTRYTTQDQQYAGQYTGYSQVQYSGNRNYTSTYTSPANFTGVRAFGGSRNYAGNYTSPANFTSPAVFAGTRPANYAGVRTGSYVGNRAFNFLGTTPANYTGPRSFAGTRASNFLGTTPTYYVGPRSFAGTRSSAFGGVTPTYYVGPRSFLGPRSAYFSTTFYQNFARYVYFEGPQQAFGGPSNFNGPMPANFGVYQSFAGVGGYQGTRVFTRYQPFEPIPFVGSRWFQGPKNFNGWRLFAGSRTWQFAGSRNYTGPRGYLGTRNYAGTRVGSYLGTRNSYFAANFNFLGTTPANYTGVRPGNFASNNNFLGVTPANYSGVRPGNFASNAAFLGVTPANYSGTRPGTFTSPVPGDFAGFADANFTGIRTFGGTRSFGGSRNYASSNYTSGAVFTGIRGFAGSRTYTANFTGNYTNQYTGQYTGATLIDTPETVETYTLYVRVD